MKERADLVRGWLRKAGSDPLAMDASAQAGAYDAACFQAQPAVEKAVLVYHGVAFPRSHNLAKLTELCSSVDLSFPSLLALLTPLTPCALEMRYDESFCPPREVVREASSFGTHRQGIRLESLATGDYRRSTFGARPSISSPSAVDVRQVTSTSLCFPPAALSSCRSGPGHLFRAPDTSELVRASCPELQSWDAEGT